MGAGYLIIGVSLGGVAMAASLMAGASGIGALLAYMLGGSLAITLVAARLALVPRPARH